MLNVASAMEGEENALVVPESTINRADLAHNVLGTRGFEGIEEGPVEGDRSQPRRASKSCGADIHLGYNRQSTCQSTSAGGFTRDADLSPGHPVAATLPPNSPPRRPARSAISMFTEESCPSVQECVSDV